MCSSQIAQSKHFEDNRLGQAAFQAFLNIASQWHLDREQQKILLGGIPTSTYHTWKRHVQQAHAFKLPRDTLERISYILGIYKAIHILLPTHEAANSWLHRSNSAPLFNNQSALEKMLAGNIVDLADVRRYLDAQRG